MAAGRPFVGASACGTIRRCIYRIVARDRASRHPTTPGDLPGDFRHRRVIDVRFADTDAMGHVNNAVYLTYCETARIPYWTDVTGEPVRPGTQGQRASSWPRRGSRTAPRCSTARPVTVETRARGSAGSVHAGASPDRTRSGAPARLAAVERIDPRPLRLRGRTPRCLSAEFVAAIEAFEGRPLRDGAAHASAEDRPRRSGRRSRSRRWRPCRCACARLRRDVVQIALGVGLCRLIVGGMTWSRIAPRPASALAIPAAPTRWPIIDFGELIATLYACSP